MAGARGGLVVGVGSIYNVLTNTEYGVQAGFELNLENTNIEVEAGETFGTIPINTNTSFGGSISWRELTPEIMADILGASIVLGSTTAVRQTLVETVTTVNQTITLAEQVNEFDDGGVLLRVVPSGATTPMDVIEGGAPSAGQVSYTNKSGNLTINATEYPSGGTFTVTYSTKQTGGTHRRVQVSPANVPQPKHFVVALQLHQRFASADIGSGIVIEMVSCTLDGTTGPFGAPVAGVGTMSFNFKARAINAGDIVFHFNPSS